ncbi:TPA: four helix bundle protein [Candidatus Peribacteria bacterium]|nr:MAG: hypothetical protein A3J91_05245 [Candidatus Peribacteria bacterium RIFOXYC2_FULL_58_10]OGJ84383.1 MAG: hypothetical protein A2529_03230 [Candidatus Peribacteria bacterium RIFOXYD2_FULL_58_15]HAI97944.1 four helix bundle protein [Candidatus Peribacteria bacterium]HAS34690.1 four helix bundle protein [Candidatus Peribacteria bacterium]
MPSLETFTIWQKEMALTKEIYAVTKSFPPDERFGLTSQLRRAATSVLANTAEGLGRRMPADKANKYTIARGECSEVRALLLLSIELEYLSSIQANEAVNLLDEIGKMLNGLIRAHSLSPISTQSP